MRDQRSLFPTKRIQQGKTFCLEMGNTDIPTPTATTSEICSVFGGLPLAEVSAENCARLSATPRRNILHCSPNHCTHKSRACYNCYIQGALIKWPKECCVINPISGFCEFHEENGGDARRSDDWQSKPEQVELTEIPEPANPDKAHVFMGEELEEFPDTPPRPRFKLKIRPKQPTCPIYGTALNKVTPRECDNKSGMEFWAKNTCGPIGCRHPSRACGSEMLK